MIHEFRGLATSQAMDQAQIARNIASGQFWKTDFVRPRAVGQLQDAGKNVATAIWHDTYNAPLPPLVNAFVLWPIKKYWKMTPREIVYSGDKAIAFASMCFFLVSLVFLYFTAKRLFDQRLALLGTGLVLLSDTIWQYSLSGLPQMLLMFLFNGTLYVLVRAVQAQYQGGTVGIWLGLVGFGFGLLALSHALTIWMFLAALVFSFFFFRPRGWAAVIILGMFMFSTRRGWCGIMWSAAIPWASRCIRSSMASITANRVTCAGLTSTSKMSVRDISARRSSAT